MAKLVTMSLILQKKRRLALKERRNERRLMRYMDKAFSMHDEEFKANYRVSKDVFEEIYETVKPFLQTCTRKSDISSKYKVLVTLSFYATGSYQRLVGGTYGTLMSQQSVSRSIADVTEALNQQSVLKRWIVFPKTRPERDVVKRRFFEKFGIPSVIGCIDGTHIALVKPIQNEERFYNRKHFHSRNVMIICDADLKILAVDSSFGGASHDSFVWNQHPIKQHLINLNINGESVFLLGDSGYAQREYMMTPIANAVEGSPEAYYTKLHCSARNTVERTIGVLKNRWRCLLGHRVLHYHPSKAAKIINACCVLHNICLQIQTVDNEDTMFQEHHSVQEGFNSNTAVAELRRGLEKRNILVQQLWANRR